MRGPTTSEVLLALWRSRNPAESAARQDTTRSPRSQQDADAAKVSLLANALEWLVPPSLSGILPINVCMAGSHLSPPQGQVGGKYLLQFWLFILNAGFE